MVMVTEHHHQESGSLNGGALKRNIIDSTTKSCHYSNGKFSFYFVCKFFSIFLIN